MPRTSSSGSDGVAVSWLKDDSGSLAICLMRVRDEVGRYKGKRFPIVSFDEHGKPNIPIAASQWAKRIRKEYASGRSSAGNLNILDLGKSYVQDLHNSGANKSYANHILLVAKALDHEGINDLKAQWFPVRFQSWLSNLKANWWEKVSDTTAKDEEGRFKFRRNTSTKISPSTKNKILREVRSLINYALKLPGHPLTYDPLAAMRQFKEDETQKELFTISELKKMVSDENRKDPWWLPCCLLVYTGCRVQEAMHLRWEWIDWENDVISLKIRPEFAIKGSKERDITLQPELKAILQPIMKADGWIIESELMRSNGFHEQGRRKRKKQAHPDYTPAFHRYLARIKITEEGKAEARTAHSTRHCFITLQLAMGVREYEVMATVGHRQFSTTLGYAVRRQKYEKEVKAWPRGEMCLRKEVEAK